MRQREETQRRLKKRQKGDTRGLKKRQPHKSIKETVKIYGRERKRRQQKDRETVK